MRVGSTVISYLANWGDNVAHRAQHGGQGANRVPNLCVDAPRFPLLCYFIEGSHPDQRPGHPRADLSSGGSSSRAAPLATKGAGDADTEACPIATSTKDASGAPPSVHPDVDMATCMDGSSSHTSSAYDAEDTISHAAPATGAPGHALLGLLSRGHSHRLRLPD